MERCKHQLPLASCSVCSWGTVSRAAPKRTGASGLNDQVSAFGPPPSMGLCQFLTRAGKPCRNPGRYWVDGRWSCSRNHRPMGA